MKKVKLVVIILLAAAAIVFAFYNSNPTILRIFIKPLTLYDVPVWSIIYAALLIGFIIGYISKRKKKE